MCLGSLCNPDKDRNEPKDPTLTLNIYRSKVPCIHQLCPQDQNIDLFCSEARLFRDTRFSKIGNAPNDLIMTLNTKMSKVPVHIKYLPPKVQILFPFAIG